MKLSMKIAALFGAASVLALGAAEPAFATIQYNSDNSTTGFDVTTAGSLPAGWTSVTGTWQAVTTAPVVPSHTKSLSDPNNTQNDSVILTSPAAIGDMEVTSTQTILVNASKFFAQQGVRVRSSSAATSGYIILCNPNAGTLQLQLYKEVGGSYTQVGANVTTPITYSNTIGTQVPINLRVAIVGSTITAKAWSVGTAEPASPQLSTTDSSVTGTGYAGLLNNGQGNSTYVVGVTDFVLNDNPGSETTGMTITTPPAQTATATISGVYQGTAPPALQYALDGGTSYSLISGATIGGGTFSFVLSSLTAGYHQLSLQNMGSTVETTATPAFQTQTSAAATALSLGGPSSGPQGQASSNFTISTNGALASNTTVTLSDDQGCTTACFTPSSPVLPSGSSTTVTFTYAPQVSGTRTITVSASGLTSATASYAVASVISVTSAGFHFSPGNWGGNSPTCTGSMPYRCPTSTGGTMHSWNNGAYFQFYWNTASSPTLSFVLLTNSNSTSKLGCYVNGYLTDNIAATGTFSLTSGVLANAANYAICHLRNSSPANRWNGGLNSVTLQGVSLDAGSTPGTAPGYRPWVRIPGDSQSEGSSTLGANQDDELVDYTFLIGQQLLAAGYDYSVAADYGNGYLYKGDNNTDIPAYYYVSGGVYNASLSRWNLIDQNVSLLDSIGHESADGKTGHEPSLILINMGANDAIQSLSVSDFQAAVTGDVQAEHAAAPSAPIINLLSFGLAFAPKFTGGGPYVAALQAGTAAAGVGNASFLNLNVSNVLEANTNVYGGDYNSSTNPYPTHFNNNGHAYVAPMIMNAINKALVTTTYINRVH